MSKFSAYFWFFALGLSLFGCSLFEANQGAGDIAGFAPPTAVAAQNNAIVRLEPSTRQVNVGDVTAVEIRIDNAANLVAASVQLQFDPAILQVQDTDPGKDGVQIQPGNFPSQEFVAFNVVTNTTGLITYDVTDLAPFELINQSGLLVTINFQAISTGSSALTFIKTTLANNLVQPIPATAQSGQITVGQGPTSTPTNTPLPGQETATFTPIPLPDTPTLTPVIVTPIMETATPTPLPTSTPTTIPTATSTPIAPQVEIPPGATVGQCYRVQPGDTLYSLAQQFGTDPQFISLANDLYPPGHIYPQQVLFMPTAYGRGPNVYQVQAGDTLAMIGERCHLEVDFLAWVNGLIPGANLADIEWLIIPRPPYAPPSRYPYPQVGPPSVWPPPCCNRR